MNSSGKESSKTPGAACMNWARGNDLGWRESLQTLLKM